MKAGERTRPVGEPRYTSGSWLPPAARRKTRSACGTSRARNAVPVRSICFWASRGRGGPTSGENVFPPSSLRRDREPRAFPHATPLVPDLVDEARARRGSESKVEDTALGVEDAGRERRVRRSRLHQTRAQW